MNRINLVIAALALLAAGPALAADRVVNAGEPVVISDDVLKRTTEVVSAANASAGDSNNRSGLGDGTNPGQGSGTSNSPNEGTDNPNNAGGGGDSSGSGSNGGGGKGGGKP